MPVQINRVAGITLSGGLLCCVLPLAAQTQAPVADTQALLAQLKDVHAPVAPSWWPPAPGWWVLAALVLLGVLFLRRWWRNKNSVATPVRHWRESAVDETDRLEEMLTNGAPLNQVVAGASMLMRRVALARLPREAVANVADQPWLQMLDELGDTDQFSAGAGRLLIEHPYRRDSDIDHGELAELLALMRRTINREVTRDV